MKACDAIFEPVIAHVKGFGSFHADLGFENVMGSGVVGLKWGAFGRLLVAHFFKRSCHRNSFLCIHKEANCFGFGGGSRNSTNSFAEYVNGTIGGWLRRSSSGMIAEKKQTSTTTASIG